MGKTPPKYSRSWAAVKRIGKARDGDIIVLDPSFFSPEEIERIQKHIKLTSHPRARVLIISSTGGIRQMSRNQLEHILHLLDAEDSPAAEETEEAEGAEETDGQVD